MGLTKKHCLGFLAILLAAVTIVTAVLVDQNKKRRPLAHIEIVEAAYYFYTTTLYYTCTADEVAYVEEQLRAFESVDQINAEEEKMLGEMVYLR